MEPCKDFQVLMVFDMNTAGQYPLNLDSLWNSERGLVVQSMALTTILPDLKP